jgi:hypothetical protein
MSSKYVVLKWFTEESIDEENRDFLARVSIPSLGQGYIPIFSTYEEAVNHFPYLPINYLLIDEVFDADISSIS